MGCSPCASVGNGASWRPAVDAKRYRVEEARRYHPFSPDFPGGTLMLKRVVAIFDATQKVPQISWNVGRRWRPRPSGRNDVLGLTATFHASQNKHRLVGLRHTVSVASPRP